MKLYRTWLAPVIFFMLILAIFTASPALEAANRLYAVAVENALLRENPSPDSAILIQLKRFDQVEFLDSNGSGWWKVRSLKNGVTGWMTADLLTASRTPAGGPGYFYVNTSNLNLHSLPLYSSAVTGGVKLNDRVEKLGSAPGGWTKVRNLQDGKKGWLPTRYLSAQAVDSPQPVGFAPKKRVKRSVPLRKKPKVEKKAPEEERPKPM